MVQNFPNNSLSKLNNQICEAYAKVLYTQVCHEKMANRFESRDNLIKIAQIILSALTAGGFVAVLAMPDRWQSIAGAIASVLLLMLNTYAKGFNLIDKQQKHQTTATKLWKVREEYTSLLIDFDNLAYELILSRRDELQCMTYTIYTEAPRTDKKSYEEAQKALKVENEQSFSQEEIAHLLPESLRSSVQKEE